VTDWEVIASDLDKIVWPNRVDNCVEDIENSIRLIQSHIQVAMLNITKGILMKNSYSRLIPKTIHNLIKEKGKLQRRLQKARNLSIKNQIKLLSKQIRSELKLWELELRSERLRT